MHADHVTAAPDSAGFGRGYFLVGKGGDGDESGGGYNPHRSWINLTTVKQETVSGSAISWAI